MIGVVDGGRDGILVCFRPSTSLAGSDEADKASGVFETSTTCPNIDQPWSNREVGDGPGRQSEVGT